jgi:hypothetical protein
MARGVDQRREAGVRDSTSDRRAHARRAEEQKHPLLPGAWPAKPALKFLIAH